MNNGPETKPTGELTEEQTDEVAGGGAHPFEYGG
jgi:hypothetical protein